MGKKLVLGIVLGLLAALTLACEYVPPPGGSEAYCYRIEQELPGSNGWVFYTNVKPEQVRGQVVLHDVSFAIAWAEIGHWSRFDRSFGKVVLDTQLADVKVSFRCPVPVSKED